MKDERKNSLAYMIGGSVPVALWLQLMIGGMNTKVDLLSEQIRILEIKVSRMQELLRRSE